MGWWINSGNSFVNCLLKAAYVTDITNNSSVSAMYTSMALLFTDFDPEMVEEVERVIEERIEASRSNGNGRVWSKWMKLGDNY